jgi:hypothetical protein
MFPFMFEVLYRKLLVLKSRVIVSNQCFVVVVVFVIVDGPLPLPVNRMQVSQGI